MAAAVVQRSESFDSAPQIFIRSPRSSDIPLLAHVERSGAEVFRTVGLDFLLDGPTVDPSLLVSMANAQHLWIAVDRFDQPVGFMGGEYLDGNFHILEISVAQEYQGKGIGKALMTNMVEQVKKEGYKLITLTTFRDVPWNAPWYSKMGFREVKAQELGIRYQEILEVEAQHGLDIRRRCVMKKVL